MSQGTVVSFQDATRARIAEPHVVSEADLRAHQRRLSYDDCHFAFHRLTLTLKLKTQEQPVFQDLSLGFPKGRKIAVLGHKGVGKQKIFDLVHFKVVPRQGKVLINSSLSWPSQMFRYFDMRSTVRDNVIFVARVMGVHPTNLMGAFLEFTGFGSDVQREPLKNVPDWGRRRLGLLVLLASDFDCLLINGPFRRQALKLDDTEAEHAERRLYGHDYVATCDKPKMIPPNCELVYLLHEGLFYEFEDIDQAIAVFETLPEPKLGPAQKKDEDAAEEDEFQDMMM